MKTRQLFLIVFLSIVTMAMGQNKYLDNIKAAKNGDANAQKEIGNCYLNGEGVARDYVQAYEWFSKAAEHGYPDALCKLGDMYARGLGVDQDYAKAFEWHAKAAEQGCAYSQGVIGYYYLYGYGTTQDFFKAYEWSTEGASQEDALSQCNLGDLYYLGNGVPKDYKKAYEWYIISANHGYPKAQSNVGYMYHHGLGVKKDNVKALFWYTKAADQGDAFAKENLARVETEIKAGNSSNSAVDNDIYVNNTIDKNMFAVVIGNEKYKNEVEVPYASNDAKIFGEYVEKTLGVPHEQIKLVENASYNDLRIAINWITQAMKVCRGKGKAIIYYAGHGIPNESDQSAYLLPVDGIGNDPASGYSLKELYEKLGNVEAQSITIFLDACFSGSKREEGMLTSARGVAIKVKAASPKGNLIVFSAAQGDETAYPYMDKQHGLFTYFLLKKLQETKGDVSLGDLSDYLIEEVGRQSFIKNNKMQTPTVNVSSALEGNWRNIKLK